MTDNAELARVRHGLLAGWICASEIALGINKELFSRGPLKGEYDIVGTQSKRRHEPDPYEKHRIWEGETVSCHAMPANIEARKRNIAALKAEFDRPAPTRFPSEARSDRVTGYRRWP